MLEQSNLTDPRTEPTTSPAGPPILPARPLIASDKPLFAQSVKIFSPTRLKSIPSTISFAIFSVVLFIVLKFFNSYINSVSACQEKN